MALINDECDTLELNKPSTDFRSSLLKVVAFCLITFNAYAADVGDLPPDELGKVDGKIIRLSDNPGTVRIVTFWATWCPPCRRELPVLAQIQANVGTDALQVYAINYKESPRLFKKLSRQLGKTDMVFVHDRRGGVGDAYDVGGIPHMVIIGKDGKIAYRHVGYSDSVIDRLIDELNTLLTAEG